MSKSERWSTKHYSMLKINNQLEWFSDSGLKSIEWMPIIYQDNLGQPTLHINTTTTNIQHGQIIQDIRILDNIHYY